MRFRSKEAEEVGRVRGCLRAAGARAALHRRRRRPAAPRTPPPQAYCALQQRKWLRTDLLHALITVMLHGYLSTRVASLGSTRGRWVLGMNVGPPAALILACVLAPDAYLSRRPAAIMAMFAVRVLGHMLLTVEEYERGEGGGASWSDAGARLARSRRPAAACMRA